MVHRVVKRRGAVAHGAVLHPLLKLLILELGGIEGVRVAHKGRCIEHASAGVRVEMVEAWAIMALDGGIVHPGAHVCGKELRQPICSGGHNVSNAILKDDRHRRTRGSQSDGPARDKAERDEVATRLMGIEGTKAAGPMPIRSINSLDGNHQRVCPESSRRHETSTEPG